LEFRESPPDPTTRQDAFKGGRSSADGDREENRLHHVPVMVLDEQARLFRGEVASLVDEE
jgi:hypothetical protein